ncbi:MAG: hypothetical protein ACRC2K_04225 [Clostridium sp.]
MSKNNFYDQFNYYVEDMNASQFGQHQNAGPSTQKPCKNQNSQTYPDNSCDDNVYMLGNNVNFSVCENDSEIKADIVVGFRKSVRVWGQVVDCEGYLVPNAYVKLLKNTPNGLVGVAHTMSDCQGFYQFDICSCKNENDYTIVVGKAATGEERIVSSGLWGTNCAGKGPGNPCNPDNCDC